MRRSATGLGTGGAPSPSARRCPAAGWRDEAEGPARLVAFPDEVVLPKATCFGLVDLLGQLGQVLRDEPGARARALAAQAAAWGARLEGALCSQARWRAVSGPPSPRRTGQANPGGPGQGRGRPQASEVPEPGSKARERELTQ
jgi:hypothetical protein